MKRYLPLLGVFLLFFLVISGFAHGQAKKVKTHVPAALVSPERTAPMGAPAR